MTTPSKTQAPAGQPRTKGSLDVDVVEDAGDWPAGYACARAVEQAAGAVASWPGLIKGRASVSVALSSDAEVAILNGQFRGKPKPTNVLSFPAGVGSEPDFLGDIILAFETVAREATEQAIAFSDHVQHLVVHGILHLLGFDHETAADAERMEALEISILAELGIANPYTGDLETAKKE